MAVGDVYRLTILATLLGSTHMNTYAFRMKSTPDPTSADVDALAVDMAAIAKARQVSACTWNTWTLHQLWGSDMTTIQDECRRDGAKILIGNFPAGHNGSQVSTEILPPQCAEVVTLGTGIAGRRRRGRSYLFGFSEAEQQSGVWTSTNQSVIQGQLATVLGEYGPAGTSPVFQLGVWSERRASGCWVPPGQKKAVNVETPHPEDAFTAVTGFTLRSTVYTQRRRTLGVGR